MAMRVEELMTRTVWACRVDEPLSAAARSMWEHDVGALPVMDAEGKLVGIVTDRDVCMAGYFTGEPLASVPVEHAMSKVVFTVEADRSLAAAEQIMTSKQIRRLPVVRDGAVVGMVSLGDLARAARRRRGTTTDEVDATFAAIVEPRPAAIPPASA